MVLDAPISMDGSTNRSLALAGDRGKLVVGRVMARFIHVGSLVFRVGALSSPRNFRVRFLWRGTPPVDADRLAASSQ